MNGHSPGLIYYGSNDLGLDICLGSDLDMLSLLWGCAKIGFELVPTNSMLLAHLNANQGGLGLLNTSHKAAPNFVISMMTCQRGILQGFQINNNTKPINLNNSIADLFDRNNNPTSDCLTQYFQLLPYIACI
jgi:hypothetical protein